MNPARAGSSGTAKREAIRARHLPLVCAAFFRLNFWKIIASFIHAGAIENRCCFHSGGDASRLPLVIKLPLRVVERHVAAMELTSARGELAMRRRGNMDGRIFSARLKRFLRLRSPSAIGADAAPANAPLLRGYVRMFRPHQWAKNSLVIVPLVTSHRFTAGAIASTILAIVAFSFAASSAYILNDLVDRPADRSHPSKRERPFASGAVPVLHGLAIAPILLAAAAGVVLLLPWSVGAALAAYTTTNLAYSLFLKRKMLVDVVTLAGLYTLRVIGGAAAIGVLVSEWLLVFSMFIFLALALVKRHAEIILRVARGLPDPANRDYRAADLPVLIALAAASGCAAVVVLALYVASPEQLLLYRHPRWLYLICPLLLYWIARVLMRSNRGELPDDPVVFALKDPVSLGSAALAALVVAAAAYF